MSPFFPLIIRFWSSRGSRASRTASSRCFCSLDFYATVLTPPSAEGQDPSPFLAATIAYRIAVQRLLAFRLGLGFQLLQQLLEVGMRPQWIEIGVFLHVGGVLVAVLDRLPQRSQGTVGVHLGSFFPLAVREPAVTLGQWHAPGKDAGGIVDVNCWIDGS